MSQGQAKWSALGDELWRTDELVAAVHAHLLAKDGNGMVREGGRLVRASYGQALSEAQLQTVLNDLRAKAWPTLEKVIRNGTIATHSSRLGHPVHIRPEDHQVLALSEVERDALATETLLAAAHMFANRSGTVSTASRRVRTCSPTTWKLVGSPSRIATRDGQPNASSS